MCARTDVAVREGVPFFVCEGESVGVHPSLSNWYVTSDLVALVKLKKEKSLSGFDLLRLTADAGEVLVLKMRAASAPWWPKRVSSRYGRLQATGGDTGKGL